MVYHSGMNAGGQFVHGLEMIDVATAWGEGVAVSGRSGLVMEASFRRIPARLPFPLIELHPDKAPSSRTTTCIAFQRHGPGAASPRSRPWVKDDNRIMEQKNQSVVEAYLGREGLDSRAQMTALNQLRDRVRLYYNLVQPMRRSARRSSRRPASAPHVNRRYDPAEAPFDPVRAGGLIAEQRECLQQTNSQTDPRRSRQETLIDYNVDLHHAMYAPAFSVIEVYTLDIGSGSTLSIIISLFTLLLVSPGPVLLCPLHRAKARRVSRCDACDQDREHTPAI